MCVYVYMCVYVCMMFVCMYFCQSVSNRWDFYKNMTRHFFATKFSNGTKWCALMYCFYYIKFKNWKKWFFFEKSPIDRTFFKM